MPYEKKTIRAAVPMGLGMSVAEVTDALSSMARALTDPYLPETVCRAKQIYAIRTGQPVPQCPKTKPNLPGGIGLRKAMVPVRSFAYAEQHTWVYPVSVAVALGVPFLLGYLIGKKNKRTS